MDVQTFTTDFPEFASANQHQIQMFISLGAAMLRPDRWDPQVLPYAIELFVAHHLAIASRDQQTGTVGGTPGLFTGPTSSKTVDKVSVSYDNQLTSLDGAGHWNLTTYGIRLIQLGRMMGTGGVQIGYPGDFIDSATMQ